MPRDVQHWFFLRGLVRESAHWGEFPKQFEARVPNVRVHCLDIPGNGRYFRETSPTRLRSVVDVIRRDYQATLERERGTPENSFVLSISMGAMITIDWLQRFPREVAGAVLINTSLRGFNPIYQRLSPGSYGKILRILFQRDVRERERLILEMTTQSRRWTDALLEERQRFQAERPIRRANFFRQLVSAALHAPNLQPPQVPLLLLNSLGDQLVHPQCSESIRARWKVPMKRHAWAGHDLAIDDPDWIISQVREWLVSLGHQLPGEAPQAPRKIDSNG